MRHGLYVTKSSDYTTTTGCEIGSTLRTQLRVTQQDVDNRLRMISFHGITLNKIELAAKLKYSGKKNQYLLKLSGGKFLDCEETCLKGICIASMSNSPTRLTLRHSVTKAEANMELIRDRDELWLVPIRTIEPGEELFWRYGSSFKLHGESEEDTPAIVDKTVSEMATVVGTTFRPERTSSRLSGVKYTKEDMKAMHNLV